MARSLYTDSARQDFKGWISQKESELLTSGHDVDGELIAIAKVDGDWTCSIALAAVKGKDPAEWTLQTATVTRAEEWREDEQDCALLRRAIELFGDSEIEVILDGALTRFVERHFAPGWMMVVFEHPKKISIIVSSISKGCGIETFPPDQLYCELLEAGLDTLQNPDGSIAPRQ
jgi:hypothetical protein